MKWLRRIFGRRPVDIAGRELRKAELQLFDVETELEKSVAVRDYLRRRINRLELFIKLEGLDRTEFDGNADRMAIRTYIPASANKDFEKPYADPLTMATKALFHFGKTFSKPTTGN